jgi:hypothetical protein
MTNQGSDDRETPFPALKRRRQFGRSASRLDLGLARADQSLPIPSGNSPCR